MKPGNRRRKKPQGANSSSAKALADKEQSKASLFEGRLSVRRRLFYCQERVFGQISRCRIRGISGGFCPRKKGAKYAEIVYFGIRYGRPSG